VAKSSAENKPLQVSLFVAVLFASLVVVLEEVELGKVKKSLVPTTTVSQAAAWLWNG
jgi:hypothetical protein